MRRPKEFIETYTKEDNIATRLYIAWELINKHNKQKTRVPHPRTRPATKWI